VSELVTSEHTQTRLQRLRWGTVILLFALTAAVVVAIWGNETQGVFIPRGPKGSITNPYRPTKADVQAHPNAGHGGWYVDPYSRSLTWGL
jgi:hypothetical protein